jgi:hypothetical protein
MKQVITIDPAGGIHGMEHKKGQGVNLRQFGKANVKRATLIEWDEAAQAWAIKDFTPGTSTTDPTTGPPWTGNVFKEARVDPIQWAVRLPEGVANADRWNAPVLFDDYEEAVQAEVQVIQHRQQTNFAGSGVSV